MKGRPWAKLDVGTPRDARVSTLSSDGVRWAFVAVILAAKEQDRPGGFESIDHLRAVVSPSVGDAIQELVDKGLLSVDPDGGVHVANWKKYQIDPTKSERAARYREKIAAEKAIETRVLRATPPRNGRTESVADIVRRVAK